MNRKRDARSRMGVTGRALGCRHLPIQRRRTYGARYRRSSNVGCDKICKPRHALLQTFVGAVFLDDAVALGRRWELAAPGDARAATEVLENHRLAELHRFHVIAAAVAIDDALRRHDLFEGDALLIVAAVGAVHDEAPNAGQEIETESGRGEAEWSPPLRQVLWVG